MKTTHSFLRVVLVVVHESGSRSVVVLKPSVDGQLVAVGVAHVPLAHQLRAVAELLEVLRQQTLGRGDASGFSVQERAALHSCVEELQLGWKVLVWWK